MTMTMTMKTKSDSSLRAHDERRHGPLPGWFCTKIPGRHDIAKLNPGRGRQKGFETVDQARALNRMREGRLRHSGSSAATALADKLAGCRKEPQRCLSSACPICMREWRRWLFAQLSRSLKHPGAKSILTVVVEVAKPGKLLRADVAALHERFRRRVQRTVRKPLVLIGGTEAGWQAKQERWSLHLHLLAIGPTRRFAKRLAHRFKWPGARPIQRDDLQNPVKQLSYLQKMQDSRRAYRVGRQKFQTRRLKAAQAVEELLWLDAHEPKELLFLRSARRWGDEIVVAPSSGSG